MDVDRSVVTETILIADDNDVFRTTLMKVLHRIGYQVLNAPDGAAAVEIATDHPGPIHLMLCDVIMPPLHGLETVARVMVLRPAMKVLFMSGYDVDELRTKGEDMTLHAFIAKPFDAIEIALRILEILHPKAV
jgi:CheY-like chemotaxis protein